MENNFEVKDYMNDISEEGNVTEEEGNVTENVTEEVTTKNWIKPQGPNVEASHYRSIELRKIQKKILRLIDDTDMANISKTLIGEYNSMLNSLSMVIALENSSVVMGDVLDV